MREIVCVSEGDCTWEWSDREGDCMREVARTRTRAYTYSHIYSTHDKHIYIHFFIANDTTLVHIILLHIFTSYYILAHKHLK